MYDDDFEVTGLPEGTTYNVLPQGGTNVIAKDAAAKDKLEKALKQGGSNDLTATGYGLRIIAIVAVAFCLLGALILAFYKEKKVMGIIEAAHKKENLPE